MTDNPDTFDVVSRLRYVEGRLKAQEDSRERERVERHHQSLRRGTYWTGVVMGAILMGAIWFTVSMVFGP